MQRPSSRRGEDGLRPTAALKPMQGMYPQPAGVENVGFAPFGGVPLGSSAPLGTAARPITGQQRMGTAQRLTTAQRQAAANRPGSRGGVGLATNLQVADRPVTQQGMMGMKTGAQGPGRQVQDKTFYLGEVRKKIEEMNAEITRMSNEMEQITQDTTTYSQLERRDEALIKEVRELQGTLADYNLVVDKPRDNIDPEQIREQQKELRARNDVEKKKVDEIFTKRQANELEIKQIEKEIENITAQAEAKLNALAPEKRRRYATLQQDNARLSAELSKKQAQYDQLCAQLSTYEEMLAKEPLKQKLASLQEQRQQLEARKRELEMETGKEQLSAPQMREKLLAQVKEDNNQIAITKRKIQEAEEYISRLGKQLNTIESGGAGGGGAGGDGVGSQYEQLQVKVKAMDEFLAGFEVTHKEAAERMEETQRVIVELLEHISKDLQRQHNMPSADRVAEMRDELEYKRGALEKSQTTAERLQHECETRQAELEKIKNLDVKIAQELNAHQERMKQMREELAVFSDVDKLRSDSEAKRKAMIAQKTEWLEHKEALRQQVSYVVAAYEAKKQALSQDDNYQTLESLELKLSHYEQNIFHLSDYVEAKRRETNYGPQLQDVSNLVAELNAVLITIAGQQAFL